MLFNIFLIIFIVVACGFIDGFIDGLEEQEEFNSFELLKEEDRWKANDDGWNDNDVLVNKSDSINIYIKLKLLSCIGVR